MIAEFIKTEFYRDVSITEHRDVIITEHHYDQFDLSDWIGHRVLVRRENFYTSGVISSILDATNVVVLLDAEATPLVYSDVLARESYGCIISDAIPSTKQVIFDLNKLNTGFLSITDLSCPQLRLSVIQIPFGYWNNVLCFHDRLALLFSPAFKAELSTVGV